jgi:hypothetical protein
MGPWRQSSNSIEAKLSIIRDDGAVLKINHKGKSRETVAQSAHFAETSLAIVQAQTGDIDSANPTQKSGHS